jgi:hypothetical protein
MTQDEALAILASVPASERNKDGVDLLMVSALPPWYEDHLVARIAALDQSILVEKIAHRVLELMERGTD